MIYERWKEWHECREWLLPALDYCHGSHTEDDVILRLASGEYRLWRFEKCAVVTMFYQYPQFKVLNIFIAGGDLSDLKSHQCEIELFAARNGCARIYSGGRDGWGKVFPDYERMGALYYKEL